MSRNICRNVCHKFLHLDFQKVDIQIILNPLLEHRTPHFKGEAILRRRFQLSIQLRLRLLGFRPLPDNSTLVERRRRHCDARLFDVAQL